MRVQNRFFRIFSEPNWRNRPHPYWFHAYYPDKMRRICIPYFTIDIFHR